MINAMSSGYFCCTCNKEHEDIMIRCFACDKQFHAKCIKINGSFADKITHDRGFHYYCELHRDLSVSDLLKKIAKLQTFHVEMKMMMDKYKDVLELQPVSELKRLENIRVTVPSAVESSGRKLRNSTKRLTSELASTDQHKKKKVNRQETEFMPIMEVDDAGPSCENSQPCEIVNVFDSLQSIESIRPIAPITNVISESALPSSNDVEIVAPILNCVPRKKSIFLSGCDANTTVEDINNFINFYTGRLDNLNIRKMNFREPKLYSSFVIDVGRDEQLFQKVCTSNFWPKNSIVREYDFFRKRQTKLTSGSPNQKKHHIE